MTIHYIILTHRYPEQFGKLVRRLDAPGVRFHVHVERSTELAPFRAEVSGAENVHFVEPRENSPVGDIGIVKATLHALRNVVESGADGLCVLISGQCWPIRSNAGIRAFLEGHPETVFMEVHEPPTADTVENGFVKTQAIMRRRIALFKFNHGTERNAYFLLPSVFSAEFWSAPRKHLAQIRYLLPRSERPLGKLFAQRRFPSYTRPYYGSQWWTMPVAVAQAVLRFVDQHPDYLDYHTYSLLPDEMFFQGVIMALKKERPALPLEGSTTYADWTTTERPRPPVMRMARFEQLVAMPPHVLFARKFDRNVDAEIFHKLDAHNNEGVLR